MGATTLWGHRVLTGVCVAIVARAAVGQASDAGTQGIEKHQLAVPGESRVDESPPAQALLMRPYVKVQRHYYHTATGESWVVPVTTKAHAQGPGDPTGACCSVLGDCTVQTESACADIGDSYLGDGTTCEPNECPLVVYSNTGGSHVIAPKWGRRIADDITTVAVGGCQMPDAYISAYEILAGVKDSKLTQDPYTVEFGIWDDCPGAIPPGELIAGTEGSIELMDDGLLHLITIDLEGAGVSIPRDLWVGVRFTSDNTQLRDKAGWIAGSPAEKGYTQDVYDYPHPSLRCRARFSTLTLYAGFYVRVYCRPDVEREFLAYYGPNTDGLFFAAGAGVWMADDLELIVDECELSSLEIPVYGTTGPFTMNVELWDGVCDPAAIIDGTQKTYEGCGDGALELAHFDFVDSEGHGVHIGRSLWLGWKFSKAGAGAIITEKPLLGENDYVIGFLDQYPECWVWWGCAPSCAVSATVRCLGDPPLGACCDMSPPPGEDYCREGPQIECLDADTRWEEGEGCDNLEAFDPPCGYAACCVPPNNPHLDDQGCVDLPAYDPPRECTTDADCPDGDPNNPTQCVDGFCEAGVGCMEIVDVEGNPAVWYPGNFCHGESAIGCFRWVCRYAEGDCYGAHSGVGCADPVCCDYICSEFGGTGRYCCDYQWDSTCASLAEAYCDVPPVNDECVDAAALTRDIACWNTQPLGLGPEDPLCYKQSNARGTIGANDPGFCCHPNGAGSMGAGSVWYTFVAEAETVEIATCTSETGVDSLVEVYSVGDPSTPANACASLTPIACIDDGGCGPSQEGNNRMTVYNLNVGETYYVQLASKSAATTGKYRVLVKAVPNGRCTDGVTACNATAQDCPESAAPCTFQSAPPEPPLYSYCAHAVQVTVDSSEPFDLDGAHMDCPIELSLPRMQNDVWFGFFTEDSGLCVATTCPQSGPGPGTTLAVYADDDDVPGIDCPVDPDYRVAANDDWGGDCGSGSRVTWPVDSLTEYMIRVGGENGSEPTGELTITRHEDCNENMIPDLCDIDCAHPDMWAGACEYSNCGFSADCQPNGVPDECDIAGGTSEDEDGNSVPDECQCPDEAVVIFEDPADGFIDARQPHAVDGVTPLQGVETFVVNASRNACRIECWSAFETNTKPDLHPGISPPNGITSVVDQGGGTCSITLERPIAHGEVTTLTYGSRCDAATTGTFTYHPADIDADGTSTAADIDVLIDSLDEMAPLPLERCDMDRSGECGPADVLRLVDLLTGAGAFEPWLGE